MEGDVPRAPFRLMRKDGVNRLRCGQAMIESVFVIIVACLCFFAIFQYANLFAAKAVLSHAAARAARSRAVGFNQWMVVKKRRVAAIPSLRTTADTGICRRRSRRQSRAQRNRVGDIWDLALETNVPLPGTQLEVARVGYMDSDSDATAGTCSIMNSGMPSP